MTNGFALNHDKSLQIYFFCIKRQAKKDFLKDVESTVSSQCGKSDKQSSNNYTQITCTSLYHEKKHMQSFKTIGKKL